MSSAGHSRARARSGASALIAAALLVGLLLGLGIWGADQLDSTRRTMQWLETNRLLEMTAQNAIEEACARFCKRPPVREDLRAISMVIVPTSVMADDDRVEVAPVKLTTSALEPQPDGTILGVAQLRVRVATKLGRHPQSRFVEVRRYLRATPDESGKSAIVQIGLVDLYRDVKE